MQWLTTMLLHGENSKSLSSILRRMASKHHNEREGDNASGEGLGASIDRPIKSSTSNLIGRGDDAGERRRGADDDVDVTQVRVPAVDVASTDAAGGGLDSKETPVPVPVPNISTGRGKNNGIFGRQGGQTSGGEQDGGLPPMKAVGWGGNWHGGGGGGYGGGGLGGGYGIDIGSGNRAAKGNDIHIRNVFKHLSEDMQIGSQNVSEADNVISVNLSSRSNPTA